MTVSATDPHLTGNEIAIIGMAGRFPGASDVYTFWQHLREGIECLTFFTEEELLAKNVPAERLNNPNYIRAYGKLGDIDLFDADFFGYAPAEAELVDPQHRLFLECAWHALEDAGYDPYRYQGLIGVYAGTGSNNYLMRLLSRQDILERMGEFQVMVGNEMDFLTTRVSYKLNLRGPSIDIQTACSTSLVAIHLACQGLLAGECDIALAGGVSILNLTEEGYIYQEGGILSPDGHCRAFDAQARGTVGGSGVGLVVLKRLEDALQNGDHIEAVIKGSAINNDGMTKVGYTAPSIDGQAAVISDALKVANVAPATVSYIETHGTGTPLGDPIEIEALKRVYMSDAARGEPCAIGSVKTNIGHLDCAAGIAGLIKTTLALKHREIPASLHFTLPNPQIDFAHGNFFVNATLRSWKTSDFPRRAAVSSFGIGGTNAHLLLEEAPPVWRKSGVPSRPWNLLPLSARTEQAQKTLAQNLKAHLLNHPEISIADVAYTLQVGRTALEHRRVIVCQDTTGALQELNSTQSSRSMAERAPGIAPPVVFMFPGQGAQHINMARQTYLTEPVFREHIDAGAEILHPLLGLDIRQIIFSERSDAESTQRLTQTWLAQPALFLVEYAFARLWMHWGVCPQAMIGHSLGEYVAACLAGVFSFPEAIKLVAQRGLLMQRIVPGTMIATSMTEEMALSFTNDQVSIAAVNGPSLCVLSGSLEAMDACARQLADQKIPHQRLHTSHAFHSSTVDPILASFGNCLAEIQYSSPQIPYISNVTGTWITEEEATNREYWLKHLRHTVRFASGIQTLNQSGHMVFLEVGPGQTLTELIRKQIKVESSVARSISSLPSSLKDLSEEEHLCKCIGHLWLAGISIDWAALWRDRDPSKVALPGYPFEHRRFWIDAPTAEAKKARLPGDRQQDIAHWFYFPCWKQRLQPARKVPEKHTQATWLIFQDTYSLGETIRQELQAQGQRVTVVLPGSSFAQIDLQTYTLVLGQRTDYEQLMQALIAQDAYPTDIVYLWTVRPPDLQSTEAAFIQAGTQAFLSLLALAQAIGMGGRVADLNIHVITNNLFNVVGSEAFCPEQALVTGPCNVLSEEYPFITCSHIDILWPVSEKNAICAHLISELLAPSSNNRLIAIRGAWSWVRTFEPVQIDAQLSSVRLREQGTYIITGGLGGIGRTFASYLSRTLKANLLLIGRTPLPASCEWEQWLATHDATHPVARKLQYLLELEKQGAKTLYVATDVADVEGMSAALHRARERFGAIHGVIHAAGLPGDGIIQLKTPEQAWKVLQPKVQGSVVLSSLLQNDRPDFFLLCSSVNALFGDGGQVDYASANAFLDALAGYHATTGALHTISVNWDAWQEVGMASNAHLPETVQQTWRQQLQNAILPEEGCEALRRVLTLTSSQVMIAPQHLSHVGAKKRSASSKASVPVQARLLAEPQERAKQNAEQTPRNSIERQLSSLWQELLGISEVSIHDNFFEIGGHSLLAIQLLTQINTLLDVELSLATIIDKPTVAQLAKTILQSRAQQEDTNVIEQMLLQIEALPESEVVQLLAEGEKENIHE